MKTKRKTLPEIVVVVECVTCKSRREIREGECDDQPFCGKCYSPMIPIRAEARIK